MFKDFAVVAAVAPHDSRGELVWDSEQLLSRVAALTYKDIVENFYIVELFPDAPEETDEYVDYVRRATIAAVRELFIENRYAEDVIFESFGGGKTVVMVEGDPLIEAPEGALLHVALLKNLALFDAPFQV